MNRIAIAFAIFAGSLVVGLTSIEAAIAPHTPEELKKKAKNILVGKALKVTSKIREYRTSSGELYRDKVFTTTIQVEKVSKGTGIKAGELVTVETWTPHYRPKLIAGWQGLAELPKKGEKFRLYLERKKGKVFIPVFPNGMSLVT